MTQTTYLLHFDRPLGDPTRRYAHASHYLGSTGNLAARLADHAAGRGARIVAAARARGIGWRLVRSWPGGWDLERRMKRWHKHARFCPTCRPELGRHTAAKEDGFHDA